MVDFIGIGFSRTGSTWLSRCLAEHPDICFSKEKETHFFNLDPRYTEGSSLYESYFDHCGKEKIRGEFTAVYTRESEKVAPRIKKDAPNAKLIVMLRNPVERAFSNYTYRKARVGETRTFKEVVESGDPMIEEGFYAKHLLPFLKLFPKNQFIFVIQEESRKDPAGVISAVYEALGVSSYDAPSARLEVNATKNHGYRLVWLQHMIQKVRMSVHASRFLAPLRKFLQMIGFTKMIAYIQKINATDKGEKEKLSPEIARKLLAVYKEDIAELEKITGRPLSVWRNAYDV